MPESSRHVKERYVVPLIPQQLQVAAAGPAGVPAPTEEFRLRLLMLSGIARSIPREPHESACAHWRTRHMHRRTMCDISIRGHQGEENTVALPPKHP